MDWLWTWHGTSFGYRNGDNLWTHEGFHVGRFAGAEVFARSGAYLGEMIGTSRLITKQTKTVLIEQGFVPLDREIVSTFTQIAAATRCWRAMRIFLSQRRCDEATHGSDPHTDARLA